MESHAKARHIIDDVEVREDIAATVEDNPGAHPVDALWLHRLSAERIFGLAHRALAVNVHD